MIALAIWAALQASPAPPIDVRACEPDAVELLGRASDTDPLRPADGGRLTFLGSAALNHDRARFGRIDLFIPSFGTIHSEAGYTSWRTRWDDPARRVWCARGGERAVAFRGEPIPAVFTRQASAPPEMTGARNIFIGRFRSTPEGHWFVGLWRRADGTTVVATFLDGDDAPKVVAVSDRPLAAVAIQTPLHGGPLDLQTITEPNGDEPAWLSRYSWTPPGR